MEKKTPNAIIYKRENIGGTFCTISKSLMQDKRLSEPAKVLIIHLLNCPPFARMSMSYYQKLLGWSNNKRTNAINCLKENGYLKQVKKPKGDGNGFSYHYTISEYGNLKSDNIQDTIPISKNDSHESLMIEFIKNLDEKFVIANKLYLEKLYEKTSTHEEFLEIFESDLINKKLDMTN
tara:strand:+ start:40848 stop:41381 length:534 start_codon:yes stop_codon:yes gene_type:complete